MSMKTASCEPKSLRQSSFTQVMGMPKSQECS